MLHGARCAVCDARCVVRGAWCKVQGARCKVQGARCKVQGAWCVVHGVWCMKRRKGMRCVVRCAQIIGNGKKRGKSTEDGQQVHDKKKAGGLTSSSERS